MLSTTDSLDCQLWIMKYTSLSFWIQSCISVFPRFSSLFFLYNFPFFWPHGHVFSNGDRWHWSQEVLSFHLGICQPLHHCNTHLFHQDPGDWASVSNYFPLNCLTFTQRPKAVHFSDSDCSLCLCHCLSAFRGSKEDTSIDMACKAHCQPSGKSVTHQCFLSVLYGIKVHGQTHVHI